MIATRFLKIIFSGFFLFIFCSIKVQAQKPALPSGNYPINDTTKNYLNDLSAFSMAIHDKMPEMILDNCTPDVEIFVFPGQLEAKGSKAALAYLQGHFEKHQDLQYVMEGVHMIGLTGLVKMKYIPEFQRNEHFAILVNFKGKKISAIHLINP